MLYIRSFQFFFKPFDIPFSTLFQIHDFLKFNHHYMYITYYFDQQLVNSTLEIIFPPPILRFPT